ncbi:MAG: hypothetical protein ACRDP6_26200, partial [Actinoallomurus sp.]
RTPYPTRRALFYGTEDSTRRSGFRFGLVFLGGRIPETAAALTQRHVGTVVSLFGWDFQHQLGRNPGGPQPIMDLVFGLGGLEQGLALPTVSTVIGLRMPNDFEFGIGPNFSAVGPALVLAAGFTRHMGSVNVPIDLAVVPSALGTRVSLTTGFNVMR